MFNILKIWSNSNCKTRESELLLHQVLNENTFLPSLAWQLTFNGVRRDIIFSSFPLLKNKIWKRQKKFYSKF